MSKFGVLYADGGDQELRVGSIRKAILFKQKEDVTIDLEECVTDPYAQEEFIINGTKSRFEEEYGDYPEAKFEPITGFGTDEVIVNRVIVIENAYFEEDLLKRPELVSGGAGDLIKGYKIGEGIDEGSTLVLVANSVPEYAAHAYLMDGDFDSSLSKLRGLGLGSVASLGCYLDNKAVKIDSWIYNAFDGGYVSNKGFE